MISVLVYSLLGTTTCILQEKSEGFDHSLQWSDIAQRTVPTPEAGSELLADLYALRERVTAWCDLAERELAEG